MTHSTIREDLPPDDEDRLCEAVLELDLYCDEPALEGSDFCRWHDPDAIMDREDEAAERFWHEMRGDPV